MIDLKDASSSEVHASDSSSSTNSSTMTTYSLEHKSNSACKDLNFINSGRCQVPRPPYLVGSTLTATSHEPPAPFGPDYITECPELPKDWEKLSQLDSCLSRPPLGGRSITSVTRTLTITSIIRSGYGGGAQILVMNNCMVAKIYDPVYYEFINEYGYTESVVYDADGDYLREAAAYTELQSSPAAVETIPVYYGSFTIDIEIPASLQSEKATRSVPLILTEYLRGETMVNIKPETLPDEVRTAIMRKTLIAECVIYDADVGHNDYCPRNIIILNFSQHATALTSEYIDKKIEIKVIDFNVATVFAHPNYKYRKFHLEDVMKKRKLQSRMMSPIVRNHGQMMEFYDWVPRRGITAEQWLRQQFQDDDRFSPVVWDSHDYPRQLDDIEDESGSSDSGISMEN